MDEMYDVPYFNKYKFVILGHWLWNKRNKRLGDVLLEEN